MTSRSILSSVLVLALAAAGARSVDGAQEGTTKQSGSTKQSSTTRSTTTRSSTAKGALPDPVLLDGSTQPVEKRPEYGMVGDFELPGDENARNNRVGGPQQPQQGGGQQQNQQQGMMAGLPTMGGGGGQEQQQSQQQQQGAAGQQQEQQGQNSGNSGPQDPNAKAEGMQVAQLETDPDAGGEAGPETGPKPQPVSIGDKAMQIKSVANAPNIVGAQQPSTAQQMEKQVGGSKASAAPGRNATERGRAMPSGL